jgi:arylsulfatase A-like enzyme
VTFRFVAAAAYLCALFPAIARTSPEDRPPNILFILADDLGVTDLACYGARDASTPHLDRLAAEGARFTTAYCAQPICSASRAAILTGKTPARLRLTSYLPGRPDAPSQLLLQARQRTELPLSEVTLAERLRRAGYATGYVGKWHLGAAGFSPLEQGFDTFHEGKADTPLSEPGGAKDVNGLTAAAESFLEQHHERPFFLFLGHYTPHVPLLARAEDVARHAAAFNPTYAAMVEALDDSVGRLLRKLDDLGLRERTLVVFTSDNGGLHVLEGDRTPSTRNSPFRAGKGFCYEGGLRVPQIVRWPGHVPAGVVLDAPVIGTDWTPTLLELAKLPLEAQPGDVFDGASFAPLLLRGEPPPARALCWHFPHYTNQGSRPAGAIREGGWKLVEHLEDGACELFFLASDPGEATDVAAREPERVAKMRGQLEAWRRMIGAERSTANPEFSAEPWRQLYLELDASRIAGAPTADRLAVELAAWRKRMDGVLPHRDGSPGASPGRGAYLLDAKDAVVHGTRLRYEGEPVKDTLGYWTQPEDWAEWTVDVRAAGRYDAIVLAGCGAGSGGAEVELRVGEAKVRFRGEVTGHFQRFVPRSVGTVTIAAPGKTSVSIHALAKPGPAVLDVRRVLLRAADGEG